MSMNLRILLSDLPQDVKLMCFNLNVFLFVAFHHCIINFIEVQIQVRGTAIEYQLM